MKSRGIGFILYMFLSFSSLYARDLETVVSSSGTHLYGSYYVTIGLANFGDSFISTENLITFRGIWNLENENGISLKQVIRPEFVVDINQDAENIYIEFEGSEENFCPIKRITINKMTKEIVVLPYSVKTEFFFNDTRFDVRHEFHRFQNTPYLSVTHIERMNDERTIEMNLSIFGHELVKRLPSLSLPKKPDIPSFVGTLFYENESVRLPALDFAQTKISVKAQPTESSSILFVGEVILTDDDIESIAFDDLENSKIVLKFKKSGKRFRPIESITLDLKTWSSLKIEMRPIASAAKINPRTEISSRPCSFQLATFGTMYNEMGH